jgi:hypothetical protein
MFRPFSRRCAFLLAFIASSGCSGVGHITVTKPFDAKAEARPELVVEVPVGSVTIQTGPTEEVTVTGTLGGADQPTLDAVKVAMVQEGEKTSVIAKGPNGKSWKADLTIRTPARTNLTLNSGVGTVAVSGLEGRAKAVLGVGDLTVATQTLTGGSSFECGTGNVTLGIVAWPKDSMLKAKSGVGNVAVKLPAKLGMNVDASTGVGQIDTKGLTFKGEARSKSVVGGAIKGRTQDEPDGRTLKADSGTGNVRIEAE